MGMVWGVAAASTIIQNILSSKLPSALSGIPNKEKVIPSPLYFLAIKCEDLLTKKLTTRLSMILDIPLQFSETWIQKFKTLLQGYTSKL
jgi:hypothetical protein